MGRSLNAGSGASRFGALFSSGVDPCCWRTQASRGGGTFITEESEKETKDTAASATSILFKYIDAYIYIEHIYIYLSISVIYIYMYIETISK